MKWLSFLVYLWAIHLPQSQAMSTAPPAPPTTVPPGVTPVGVDFRNIPPSTTYQDSIDKFAARRKAILDSVSSGPLPAYTTGDAFGAVSLAKFANGVDVSAINSTLLGAVVYAQPGTDFQDLNFLCMRVGDYDFLLRPLVASTYWFGGNPSLISPAARQRLLNLLLSTRGNQVSTRVGLRLCGSRQETENHILQTEIQRYLVNQLLEKNLATLGKYDPLYDNAANGMTDWMLKHMQQFLQHDFSEYNSKPYQIYSVMAVENLFEFAEDQRVKTAAELVLNYLDAKFAISSNGLRRAVPFRRQGAYAERSDIYFTDDEAFRMALLVGNYEHFSEFRVPYLLEYGVEPMISFSLGKYRTPEVIHDLIMHKDHNPYYQRIHHLGYEVYASTGSYLISGGGYYVPMIGDDLGSGEDAGQALPTTLMPTAQGIDWSQFIRINGSLMPAEKVNLCVAPDFACGLEPVIPANIPVSCRETRGRWTFVDFTSAGCPLKYGFYVAVYAQRCNSAECGASAGKFGFFEAAEAKNGLTYATFRDGVLKRNGGHDYQASDINEYITTRGQKIQFVPQPSDRNGSQILAVGELRVNPNLEKWRLAEGQILHADGSGIVVVDNAFLGRRLVLDYRDYAHPLKYELSMKEPFHLRK